jgi:hypothetical protein
MRSQLIDQLRNILLTAMIAALAGACGGDVESIDSYESALTAGQCSTICGSACNDAMVAAKSSPVYGQCMEYCAPLCADAFSTQMVISSVQKNFGGGEESPPSSDEGEPSAEGTCTPFLNQGLLNDTYPSFTDYPVSEIQCAVVAMSYTDISEGIKNDEGCNSSEITGAIAKLDDYLEQCGCLFAWHESWTYFAQGDTDSAGDICSTVTIDGSTMIDISGDFNSAMNLAKSALTNSLGDIQALLYDPTASQLDQLSASSELSSSLGFLQSTGLSVDEDLLRGATYAIGHAKLLTFDDGEHSLMPGQSVVNPIGAKWHHKGRRMIVVDKRAAALSSHLTSTQRKTLFFNALVHQGLHTMLYRTMLSATKHGVVVDYLLSNNAIRLPRSLVAEWAAQWQVNFQF